MFAELLPHYALYFTLRLNNFKLRTVFDGQSAECKSGTNAGGTIGYDINN